MKTRKKRLLALMIMLAAVMTGVNAEAQRREYRSERQDSKVEKHHQPNPKSDKREYQKQENNKDRKHSSVRQEKISRHDRWDRQAQNYPKNYHDKHYKYDKRYEYIHPTYGHVYKNFRSKPVRIKHHHGDYYFYGGRYYSYRPGIGYVHVEIPRNLIFVNLPFRCERVWIGHRIYYRYDDLFFERCDLGYRLTPNVSIHLSARF